MAKRRWHWARPVLSPEQAIRQLAAAIVLSGIKDLNRHDGRGVGARAFVRSQWFECLCDGLDLDLEAVNRKVEDLIDMTTAEELEALETRVQALQEELANTVAQIDDNTRQQRQLVLEAAQAGEGPPNLAKQVKARQALENSAADLMAEIEPLLPALEELRREHAQEEWKRHREEAFERWERAEYAFRVEARRFARLDRRGTVQWASPGDENAISKDELWQKLGALAFERDEAAYVYLGLGPAARRHPPQVSQYVNGTTIDDHYPELREEWRRRNPDAPVEPREDYTVLKTGVEREGGLKPEPVFVGRDGFDL